VRFGGTPKPARGTRALPGMERRQDAENLLVIWAGPGHTDAAQPLLFAR